MCVCVRLRVCVSMCVCVLHGRDKSVGKVASAPLKPQKKRAALTRMARRRLWTERQGHMSEKINEKGNTLICGHARQIQLGIKILWFNECLHHLWNWSDPDLQEWHPWVFLSLQISLKPPALTTKATKTCGQSQSVRACVNVFTSSVSVGSYSSVWVIVSGVVFVCMWIMGLGVLEEPVHTSLWCCNAQLGAVCDGVVWQQRSGHKQSNSWGPINRWHKSEGLHDTKHVYMTSSMPTPALLSPFCPFSLQKRKKYTHSVSPNHCLLRLPIGIFN